MKPVRKSPPPERAHDAGGFRMTSLRLLLAGDPAADWPQFGQAPLPRGHLWPSLKRALDVALSLSALFLLSPLMFAIVAAIKLDSRGPVFHRVRRVGYRGRPLMMLKFRKMHDGVTGAPLTVKADSRLTRVGAFLTRWRLDELPQFWDVLRGRMSVIGPRPEDPSFVALHSFEYAQILNVRPGIVGLSQLAYEAETEIVSDRSPVQDYVDRILPQKLIMDQLYAANTSLLMDFSIFRWALVALILHRPVAVSRETGTMSVRRRETRSPAPPPAPTSRSLKEVPSPAGSDAADGARGDPEPQSDQHDQQDREMPRLV